MASFGNAASNIAETKASNIYLKKQTYRKHDCCFLSDISAKKQHIISCVLLIGLSVRSPPALGEALERGPGEGA